MYSYIYKDICVCIYTYVYVYIHIKSRSPLQARGNDSYGFQHFSSYASILGDVWLCAGVPWASSALAAPLPKRSLDAWAILYGKSFNLKTIFKAMLATLERIIRLFSLKWPKSPWEIVFKLKLFSYKIRQPSEGEQILFFNFLGLYHKSLDSGARQNNSRVWKG